MLRVNIAILLEFNMAEGKGKQIIWDWRKFLPQPGRTDKKVDALTWCDIWVSEDKEWVLIYQKCVQFICVGGMIQSQSQQVCF